MRYGCRRLWIPRVLVARAFESESEEVVLLDWIPLTSVLRLFLQQKHRTFFSDAATRNACLLSLSK
jgi:hypothetical protein